MNNALARRLSAEAAGAMILTLFGGSAVIAATLHGFAPDLLGPLAFGFALLTGINILGPISGAHFNPTVTVALALRGRFAWSDVPGYVIAQCVGGIVAGALMFFTFGNAGVKTGLATTHYDAHGKYVLAILLAEALGTFLLCFTVIAVTDPSREGKAPVAFAIGLALATAALAFGGVSGGSFNFARTIGPEIVNALAGGVSKWGQMWVYLVGPLVGAVVAAYAHKGLTAARAAAAETEPAKPGVKTTPKQRTGAR